MLIDSGKTRYKTGTRVLLVAPEINITQKTGKPKTEVKSR